MCIRDSICQWYNQVLQQAQYYIQLLHTTSENYYSHSERHPLHGPGQGSRAAPSLWIYISSILMQCMEQYSNGIHFTDPHNITLVQHIMTGFVDDTTHWINIISTVR